LHTQPGGHDNTVSAHIVGTFWAEPRVLFHRHKTLGKLLQVGGHVEPAEDPWSAIGHEIEEESGYRLNQLQVLQPPHRLRELGTTAAVLHPHPVCLTTHSFGDGSDHWHNDIVFAFVAAGPPAGRPGPGESPDLAWLTLKDLASLADADVFPDARAIAAYVLSEILPAWEAVPAASFTRPV
jgi:8-oxo-dGTP pyrophosphatase MutT (NUDIX family)